MTAVEWLEIQLQLYGSISDENTSPSLDTLFKMFNEAKKIEKQQTNYTKVTRFEVIDHTKDMKGRCYVAHNCVIELSLQDDNRTLKVFVNDKI